MKSKYFILVVFLFFINCFAEQQNNINADLITAMKAHHIPVVGYAIIDHYQIVAANTISIDPNIHVTKDSLFQAASISKSVSAYVALKLVAEKKLLLDKPVNQQLTQWKIPTNEYDKDNPVTLRQILSMTSGLSVAGFPGHPQNEPLPNLLQLLNGRPPANTPPIRVISSPGTVYAYSGGGFQVMQQVIEDIMHQPFSVTAKQLVLQPLQMNNSLFQYPLPQSLRAKAVPGFLEDGTMIKQGWYNFEIPAAGGIWSTPTDLAKFAINIADAYLGKNNGLIPQPLAQEMLTRQTNSSYGLGVNIDGQGKNLNFRKGGHNLGYYSELLMFPNTGQGVVIMTNSENGEAIINYMIPLIAHYYHWSCYFPSFEELIKLPSFSC